MPSLSLRPTSIRSTAHLGLVGLVRFWRWWSSELLALVPKRWKRHFQAATSDIRIDRDHVEIIHIVDEVGVRLRGEQSLEHQTDSDWLELTELIRSTRNRIILTEPDVLFLELNLPRAALGRLRAAIGLQLSLRSPLDLDFVEWNYLVNQRHQTSIDLVVALVRRTRLDGIAALFVKHDIAVPPIVAEYEGKPIVLRDGTGGAVSHEALLDRRALGVAAAMLFVSPLATLFTADLLIWYHEREAASLRRSLRPKVETVQRARNDDAARSALGPLTRLASISGTLEGLATTLPPSAFLVSLEQRPDRKLNFIVDGADIDSIERALASPQSPVRATILDQLPKDQRVRATYSAAIR